MMVSISGSQKTELASIPVRSKAGVITSPVRSFEDCLEWLQARGRSNHTIRAYEQGLEEFADLLEEMKVDIANVGELELCKYLLYMQGEPVAGLPLRQRLSSATIRQRKAAVTQWFNFLVRIKEIEANPCHHLVVRLRNTSDTEAWIPNNEEWERFLDELKQESLRNRLMAVMAYDGALRRGTLVNLERRDVLLSKRIIKVRASNSKGGSGATIVSLSDVGCRLYTAYSAYLMTVRREDRLENMKIFRSESDRNRNAAITESAWNKVVTKIAKRAGLPLFSTHTFRHLRLTHIAEAGFDVLKVKEYAGHKSLRSTERYIHQCGDLAFRIAENARLQQESLKLLELAEDL